MNDDAPPDTLIDLLNRLIEPGDPPPVSMVPQTWGWLLVAALLLLGLAVLARYLWSRHRRNAYRRAALSALNTAGDDPEAIAEILRRTALAAYPRETVAGLAGSDWLRFLDAQITGHDFETGQGRTLARAPYAETPPSAGLTALARRWVQHHRPAPPSC